MSPRRADPDARAALLAAAARLLAAHGPAALTTRRLADEAGTSTMAVYTRFGSLSDVHRAVRADGFARLEGLLRARPASADPVADLAAAALAHLEFAVAEPQLYRAMTDSRPPVGGSGVDGGGAGEPGEPTFGLLAALVRRCIDSGRFDSGLSDRDGLDGGDGTAGMVGVRAAQVWSMLHGTATLAVTGTVAPEQARFVLRDMIERLCRGFGDDPARAGASVAASVAAAAGA